MYPIRQQDHLHSENMMDKERDRCIYTRQARRWRSGISVARKAPKRRRLRCEVSGREAVERKGTGVQEATADDAV
jgi:hypothetical protein